MTNSFGEELFNELAPKTMMEFTLGSLLRLMMNMIDHPDEWPDEAEILNVFRHADVAIEEWNEKYAEELASLPPAGHWQP